MKRKVCMACLGRNRKNGYNLVTDKKLWDVYKMVVCPSYDMMTARYVEWKDGRSVDEVDPPPWCEWKLEHLVLGQASLLQSIT